MGSLMMEWLLSAGYTTLLQLLLIVSVIVISWLYLQKRTKKPKKLLLTEEEKDQLIKAWKPEPLVPPTEKDHPVLNPKYVDGKMTKKVTIDGKEYLNLSTTNYLSFVGDKRIEEVAKKTIFKYGVGSCGPRGFYGTVDVHLDLEADIAKFLGCEESVLYSYGYATVASAIPAYAKKGDVIFVDKGANYAIQKGCIASRARLEWFDHNDMDDLERLLEEQAVKDKKNPSAAGKIRRFIIVEGLYANTGNICPLARIVDFKWKYKARIFIDESYSFGVLGRTGKGVTEHYDIPVADIDMVMGSLEHSIASTGGFCVGRSYVVGHQRLAGLGYCFSASLPPLLATAANEALRIMQAEPERLSRTKELALAAHSGLEEALARTPFYVYGFRENPMKHIGYDGSKEEAEKKLDALVDKLFDEHDVMITRARYLVEDELFDINPSARFIVQYGLLNTELETALEAMKNVAHQL